MRKKKIKDVERSWAENNGKKKKKEKDGRFGEGVTDLERKMRDVRTLRIGKMREKYKSKKKKKKG